MSSDDRRLRSVSSPAVVPPRHHNILKSPNRSVPLPAVPPRPPKPPLLSSTLAAFAAAELNKTLYWKVLTVDGNPYLVPNDLTPAPPPVPIRPFVAADRSLTLPLPTDYKSTVINTDKSTGVGEYKSAGTDDGKSIGHPSFVPQLTWPIPINGPIDDDSVVLLAESKIRCDVPGCGMPIHISYAADHARFAIDRHLQILIDR